MRHVVYGLIDPRTSELRYVGRSSQHDVRQRAHRRDRSGPRAQWVQEILDLGLSPEFEVIEEYDSVEASIAAEEWAIQYFRSVGCPLLNVKKSGGGYRVGLKDVKESIIGVRVEKDLLVMMKEEAARDDVSVGHILRRALVQHFRGKEGNDGVL